MVDDTTMESAVVSRVKMDKEGTKAYALVFKKHFKNVKRTIQSATDSNLEISQEVPLVSC